MKSHNAIGEEQLNECGRPMNSGHVYFDPVQNQILHLTNRCHVYFEFDLLWKMYSTAGNKIRRIKTLAEAKEKMNQSNHVYLGKL